MDTDTAANQLAELGNSHRLQAFRLLVRAGDAGLSMGEIQEFLGIPASTLSHHISRLVWAGLVTQERQGRVLRCRADFAAMRGLVDFLADECCAGVGTNGGEDTGQRPLRQAVAGQVEKTGTDK